MRDHGGNIDWAIGQYGGAPESWVDLSTGINRVPYPVPSLSDAAWRILPTRAAREALVETARAAYRTNAAILPVAGAQAAIQMLPRLSPPGKARILSPTYNEHAATLRVAGWHVEEVSTFGDLIGADLAVVVNPNNPDGRTFAPDELLGLSASVGQLVVDESFADPRPDLSVAYHAGRNGLIVLKSFGKFYGLAGVRLGFVLADEKTVAALSEMSGPWPVSGAALEIGRVAMRDRDWAVVTTARLQQEALRIDAIAAKAGWHLVGGCELFRLYDTGDAAAAQDRLAQNHIWSRRFPWSDRWLRLGLPGDQSEWIRLEQALN